MKENIIGFQALVMFFCGAFLFQELTGAGFLVSGLFGGGMGVMAGVSLLMFLPQFYLIGMVLTYVVLAGVISNAMGLSGGSTFVLIIIAGGIGFGVNFSEVANAKSEKEAQKAKWAQKEFEANPVKALLKSENASELYEDAALVMASGLISAEVYDRICREIAEFAVKGDGGAAPRAAKDIVVKKPSEVNDEDVYKLANLSELHLIRKDEYEALGDDAAKLADTNRERQTRLEELGGALADLAACRAIDMRTFLRAMLDIDPDFPPTAAKVEKFPQRWPGPSSMQNAKLLYQRKMITLDEYQAACDIIEQAA